MSQYILAIDQGTTSSRAVVFDSNGLSKASSQQEFTQHFPENGWVEHAPNDIWESSINSCRNAIIEAKISSEEIACIGITNQRETTIVWERTTGKPIYNAIVWQDRRTSDYCSSLKQEGFEDMVRNKTGLLLDPYFSATKIRWILENCEGAREKAESGELAFGTVDCYLLWQLTKGQSHATDATNASRTMLFNIHNQSWDTELLDLFGIPVSMLPVVKDSADNFGISAEGLFNSQIPITGILGDQQAAAFGQACFEPGMAKSTYGTGCFLLSNTGEEVVNSEHQLLTTIAYRLNGKVSYAVEGSIFMAGATIQWLRDGLSLIADAADTEDLAKAASTNAEVIMVPAFTGLGAPYWDSDARGAIFGLTRGTGISEIVAAALMSVCFQTKDLVLAMRNDGAACNEIRVDGGMVKNDYFVQKLSDTLGLKIVRPSNIETTALGAAYAAGLEAKVFKSLEDISAKWHVNAKFSPEFEQSVLQGHYEQWLDAVARTRSNLFEK